MATAARKSFPIAFVGGGQAHGEDEALAIPKSRTRQG